MDEAPSRIAAEVEPARFEEYTDAAGAPPQRGGTSHRDRLPPASTAESEEPLDTPSDAVADVFERIAVTGEDGREVSHLAVRLDLPAADGAPPLGLLYLHGFGSHQEGEKAEFFRARARAAGLGFCSFDFQGHGRSGGSLADLSLTRNLADVARVLAWLAERGLERPALLGSSMGAGTGLWYAALHPGEVAAGLHIAPALELDRSLLAWAGPERTRVWRRTGKIHFENDLVSCELAWELIEDLRAHSLEELALRLETPALLLQGKRDTSVPWRTVADFTARCRYEGIELHLFADGDHRLADRKERLWALMLEFLRGRGLAGAPSSADPVPK